MAVLKIADGIYSIGVLNPNMRIFDVIMKTEFGTSYNAYLITGEKNVLIDMVHSSYYDEYIENIRSIIDPTEIDYVIMNHNEPDHSGSLSKLYETAPQIQVFTSAAGKICLRNITNQPDLKINIVKDEEELDIGNGKRLKFISAPFLHWPDSIFTWLESHKIMFTCDFLGCHYCEPRMLDKYTSYPKYFESAFKIYFDAIFGPFKVYVQNGLSKLDQFDIDFICTSHGPILTKQGFFETAKAYYSDWSKPIISIKKQVAIFYCSAYGNTALLAQKISEGICSVIEDASVDVYDIIKHNMGELKGKMNASDAFLLGTPTFNKDAVPFIWEMACGIDAINCRGKTVSAFGSYGWSGEAVPGLIARFKTLKMNVFEEGLTCRLVPSEQELISAYEFGVRFAGAI